MNGMKRSSRRNLIRHRSKWSSSFQVVLCDVIVFSKVITNLISVLEALQMHLVDKAARMILA